MPLREDKFYTMQVHLHRHYDGQNKLIGIPIEFKDLSFEQVQNTRRIIWMQGILIENTPIAFELIDPLHIRFVYFIEQPAKFNL